LDGTLNPADCLIGRGIGGLAARIIIVVRPAIHIEGAGARGLTGGALDFRGCRRGVWCRARRTWPARAGTVTTGCRTRRQGRIADRLAARSCWARSAIPLRAVACGPCGTTVSGGTLLETLIRTRCPLTKIGIFKPSGGTFRGLGRTIGGRRGPVIPALPRRLIGPGLARRGRARVFCGAGWRLGPWRFDLWRHDHRGFGNNGRRGRDGRCNRGWRN